ncbi:MAG: hypothetical protein AAF939_00775, partial [Planctomycetota bacterium]
KYVPLAERETSKLLRINWIKKPGKRKNEGQTISGAVQSLYFGKIAAAAFRIFHLSLDRPIARIRRLELFGLIPH